MRNQEYMQGKRAGVKSAIAWLHQRAQEMVDPKAKDVLNTAAFHLGVKESKTEEAMQLKSQGGTILTTTSTVTIKGPPKEPGWCDQQKIEHCWEDGPTLTMDPPIQTRRCRNCGKSQHLVSEWRDNNPRNSC